MSMHFPFEFTLEDRVHVVVHQTGANEYNFQMKDKAGTARQFTYRDEGKPKAEVEAPLDFDQLNALRRFWLEQEAAS